MKNPIVKSLTAAQQRYVLGSLFVTGAAVLILEIVGTRVISPYYGSSLYSWSALITVTLIALAGGYNLGGRYADKAPSLTLFARLTCLSGAAAAVVPLLRIPVLKMTTPLGIQLGALSSAMILIAPALLLLSTLGPLAIKLTTDSMATVGKSSGDVYAVSTLGSVIGAVLAGFVLIPHLAISRILYGLACLLLLLGSLGYYLSRLRLPLAQLAAAAAVALLGFWPGEEPSTNVLLSKESAYGQIKVLETQKRRYLLVNGTTQSMALAGTLESDAPYAQSMEWAALLRPHLKRALVIGIGSGALAANLERNYNLTADAVDIDPDIVAAARTYFNFAPRGEVFVEDGRTFVERTERRYGAVFVDAFASETPPYHLFTRESFERMKAVLEPGGIVSVNLVTLIRGGGNLPWRSTYKTLRSVFPNVRAFIASDVYNDLGNVVFFCSSGPLDGVSTSPARPGIRANLASALSQELKPSERDIDDAVLMTDDHAPLEFLLAETAVRWRRGLQDKVSSILLY